MHYVSLSKFDYYYVELIKHLQYILVTFFSLFSLKCIVPLARIPNFHQHCFSFVPFKVPPCLFLCIHIKVRVPFYTMYSTHGAAFTVWMEFLLLILFDVSFLFFRFHLIIIYSLCHLGFTIITNYLRVGW